MPPAAILPEKPANVTHTGASGIGQDSTPVTATIKWPAIRAGQHAGRLTFGRRLWGRRFGHGGRLLDGAGMLVAQDFTGGISRCGHLN